MLLATYTDSCPRDNHSHNRLIFVVSQAENMGLERIEPKPFECHCGKTLTPEALDEGDSTKKTWPDCKSWRNGGMRKCPDCEETPSLDREQHIRARGYEPRPKDEIRGITSKARQTALEKHEERCVSCNRKAQYVKRIIPPRYEGDRTPQNLAPLCNTHYDNHGHLFADILFPKEWNKIDGISWTDVATSLRDRHADRHPKFASRLNRLLDDAPFGDPYPYPNTPSH